MSRNGSGSYSAPANTWNPAVPGTTILSDDWNAILADLSTALSQSIANDGQTTTTLVIPFAQGLRVGAGTVTVPSIGVIGDTDTGLYFPAANQAAITVGGAQGLLVTTSGVTVAVALTVGDNTSIAGSLTVAGPVVCNGNVTLGNADADVLTVEATGTYNAPQTFTETITVPNASFANAKLANMATSTFKGRVTAGTGAPEDLTGAQAATILPVVVGATQSTAGTKGLVPAGSAGDQYKVLTGAGTFQAGYGRAFGCVITTTNVNGSQPTFTNGVNVASLSTLTVAGSQSSCTITFTDALPNATYGMHIQTGGGIANAGTAYGTKTTTSVIIYWDNTGGVNTEISVSGFL